MIICFSGLSGSGKRTQQELLVTALRSKGKNIFLSRTHQDAEKECLARSLTTEPTLFLFQALHIEQRGNIEAALRQKSIVVTDRWEESFLSLRNDHGMPCELDPHSSAREFMLEEIIPDVTFLLDISVEQARQRTEREVIPDLCDAFPASSLEMLRKDLLRLASERKWIVLDAARSIEEVHKDILAALDVAA